MLGTGARRAGHSRAARRCAPAPPTLSSSPRSPKPAASASCAHDDYKRAILGADADDIVLTEKLSGVPVAVIRTPYIDAIGTKAGWLAKRMPRHPRAKHWMRTFYSVRSVWQLKRASLSGSRYRDYFQAGKSVGGIHAVQPAGAIVRRFADAARARAA